MPTQRFSAEIDVYVEPESFLEKFASWEHKKISMISKMNPY